MTFWQKTVNLQSGGEITVTLDAQSDFDVLEFAKSPEAEMLLALKGLMEDYEKSHPILPAEHGV